MSPDSLKNAFFPHAFSAHLKKTTSIFKKYELRLDFFAEMYYYMFIWK